VTHIQGVHRLFIKFAKIVSICGINMDKMPKQLQRIVNMLMQDCSVSGWSLFGGSRQKLVINFHEMDPTSDSDIHPINVHYRKKSERQVKRDQDRAQSHVQNQSSQECIKSSRKLNELESKINLEDKECIIEAQDSCSQGVCDNSVDQSKQQAETMKHIRLDSPLQSADTHVLDVSAARPSQTPQPWRQETMPTYEPALMKEPQPSCDPILFSNNAIQSKQKRVVFNDSIDCKNSKQRQISTDIKVTISRDPNNSSRWMSELGTIHTKRQTWPSDRRISQYS